MEDFGGVVIIKPSTLPDCRILWLFVYMIWSQNKQQSSETAWLVIHDMPKIMLSFFNTLAKRRACKSM